MKYTPRGGSQPPPPLGSVHSYNNRSPPRIGNEVQIKFNSPQLGGDTYSNPQPAQVGETTYLSQQPQLDKVEINSNPYSQTSNFNSNPYSNVYDSPPPPYIHPNRPQNPYNVCLF